MALFSTTYKWPSSTFEFRSESEGSHDGTADVVARKDRWILKSPGNFSYASGQLEQRTVSADFDGTSAFIRGHVIGVDGDLGLRVDEIWVGTAEPDAGFFSITATFEHLADACAIRGEDGAARDLSVPLRFPAIGDSPPMEAVLSGHGDSITLVSSAPEPLEHFEKHLEGVPGDAHFWDGQAVRAAYAGR